MASYCWDCGKEFDGDCCDCATLVVDSEPYDIAEELLDAFFDSFELPAFGVVCRDQLND